MLDDDGSGALVKKMAGYHQFHAVRVAVEETLRAARLDRQRMADEDEGHYEAGRKPGGEPGDRRIGVVWHTQGSGKSLTIAFYTGAIVREQVMENPTSYSGRSRGAKTSCGSRRHRRRAGPICGASSR